MKRPTRLLSKIIKQNARPKEINIGWKRGQFQEQVNYRWNVNGVCSTPFSISINSERISLFNPLIKAPSFAEPLPSQQPQSLL